MQFSHEFHFIFSPFKILLISRDCLTYAHWAAASGKSRVVGSDGQTDGRFCLSTLAKKIYGWWHNGIYLICPKRYSNPTHVSQQEKGSKVYNFHNLAHSFLKKNFKLPDSNHSTLPFHFGTHFVCIFSNFLLLHILRYIAVKPGAINSEVIGICLIEKNHAYLIKY